MNSFRLLTHRLNKFPDRPRYRAQWANWIRLFHWRSLAIRQHCNYWNRPRRTSTPLRPASSTDEIPWKIFFQTQRRPNSLFPAKRNYSNQLAAFRRDVTQNLSNGPRQTDLYADKRRRLLLDGGWNTGTVRRRSVTSPWPAHFYTLPRST